MLRKITLISFLVFLTNVAYAQTANNGYPTPNGEPAGFQNVQYVPSTKKACTGMAIAWASVIGTTLIGTAIHILSHVLVPKAKPNTEHVETESFLGKFGILSATILGSLVQQVSLQALPLTSTCIQTGYYPTTMTFNTIPVNVTSTGPVITAP